MLVGVVGVSGWEGVVFENSVADFEDGVFDVEGLGLGVDVEDNVVDVGVESSVVEGGNVVDMVGLGKVTVQYLTKTFNLEGQNIEDITGQNYDKQQMNGGYEGERLEMNDERWTTSDYEKKVEQSDHWIMTGWR